MLEFHARILLDVFYDIIVTIYKLLYTLFIVEVTLKLIATNLVFVYNQAYISSGGELIQGPLFFDPL